MDMLIVVAGPFLSIGASKDQVGRSGDGRLLKKGGSKAAAQIKTTGSETGQEHVNLGGLVALEEL